jgi:hypothetical protein
MAAVITKKPTGDVGVQLTFPSVFEDAYKTLGTPMAFAPDCESKHCGFLEGDDVAAAYHEQKRKDAHHMAAAGVAARKAAEARMLSSHMNYFKMPKPVLSQRVFANPSLGNQPGAIDSARRTMPGSVSAFRCLGEVEKRGAGENPYETQLQGGFVLRTKTGQEWVDKRFQGRISQLNAIDSARASDSLDTGEGVRYPGLEDEEEGEFPIKSQIDLVGALGQINNAMMTGNLATMARFTLEDISKAVKLLARWSITAPREEYREAIDLLDELVEEVMEVANEEQAQMDNAAPGDPGREKDKAVVMSGVLPRLVAMRDYVRQMYDRVELTPKDRKARSKALLKSTGLTSFRPKKDYGDIVREVIADEGLPQPRAAAIPRFNAPRGPGGDDEDGGDDGPGGPQPRPVFDREERQRMAARGPGQFIGDEGGAAALGAPGGNEFRRRMPDAGLRPLEEAALPAFAQMPRLDILDMDAEGDLLAAPRVRVPIPGQRPGSPGEAQRVVDAFYARMGEAPPAAARRRAAAEEEEEEEEAVAAPARPAAARPAAAAAAGDVLGEITEEARAFLNDRVDGADSFTPNIRRAAENPALFDGKRRMLIDALDAFGKFYGYARQGFEPGETYTRGKYVPSEGKTYKKGERMIGKRGQDKPFPRSVFRFRLQNTGYYGLFQELKGEGRARPSSKRDALPKTREGYIALAEKLRSRGINIRVNSRSSLKSIRANFIRKLGL